MSIREKLQATEDEQDGGHKLKTNDEIIDMLIEYGNDEAEFHTADVQRLVMENERVKKIIDMFNSNKIDHELPNKNNGEYNYGYVKAMNIVINHLKAIF